MKLPRRNKYNATKVELDGHTFASKREAEEYVVLRHRERTGWITNLEVHPVFKIVVNGRKIGRYTADFKYAENRKWRVIDVKSPPTARGEAFRLRKKLVEALYDIVVEVVY